MIKSIFVFILSILLVICLVSGVLILSAFGVLGYNLETAVGDNVDKGVQETFNSSSLEEIEEGLRIACEGRNSIEFDINGKILSIECSNLETKSVEEIIGEEAGEVVNEALEKSTGVDLGEATDRIWNILTILGITCLVIIGLIVFLEGWGSLTVLGIAFLISGLPFVLSWFIVNFVEGFLGGLLPEGVSVTDLPQAAEAFSSLAWVLFRNYLIVFVLGAILLGLGVGIKMGLGSKK